MDRQLINHLPEWLREFDDFKRLCAAEQEQVEKIWSLCERIWNNNFIESLDAHGCERWENMLHIKPKDTYSLEERRKNILIRVVEQRPFTMSKLRQMLNAICGIGEHSTVLEPAKYSLTCKIKLTSKNMLEDVKILMKRVVPANIVINVDLMYNTYAMLGKYTYEELSSRTYRSLREDVI